MLAYYHYLAPVIRSKKLILITWAFAKLWLKLFKLLIIGCLDSADREENSLQHSNFLFRPNGLVLAELLRTYSKRNKLVKNQQPAKISFAVNSRAEHSL